MTRKVRGSSYMNWAKTRSTAKFNLATSGLGNLKLRELRVSLDDLEITDGGYGYQPLIQSIATRYRVAPEQVVTAAGTTFANHLAMAALIKPGDEILFEHPAYEPMLALARYLGAYVKRFSRRFEDAFQISLAELERLVTPKTRLIVITNLHNPSGVLISDASMKQIGEIARRVGARVLVDEVYMETLFEESPRTSFHLGEEFLVTREDLEVVRPEFGTVMFPRVRHGTSERLCQLLREKYETSVVPGVFFEMPAHFRIGIAGNADLLSEGLKRIGLALDERRSTFS